MRAGPLPSSHGIPRPPRCLAARARPKDGQDAFEGRAQLEIHSGAAHADTSLVIAPAAHPFFHGDLPPRCLPCVSVPRRRVSVTLQHTFPSGPSLMTPCPTILSHERLLGLGTDLLRRLHRSSSSSAALPVPRWARPVLRPTPAPLQMLQPAVCLGDCCTPMTAPSHAHATVPRVL